MSLSPLCPEPWGKEVRKARSQSCSSVVLQFPQPPPRGGQRQQRVSATLRPGPHLLYCPGKPSLCWVRERWGSGAPKGMGTQKQKAKVGGLGSADSVWQHLNNSNTSPSRLACARAWDVIDQFILPTSLCWQEPLKRSSTSTLSPVSRPRQHSAELCAEFLVGKLGFVKEWGVFFAMGVGDTGI